MFHKLRDPVSGLMHLGAALAAFLGLVIMLYLAQDSHIKQMSLLIYGISLVLMFSASAAYHLIKAQTRVDLYLRKLDHSAIYLLIAGTYTPICLYFFTGFWKWGMLAIIWSVAIIGITVKLLIINAPRWLTAGTYLVMGWLAIIAIKEILIAMPPGAMVWLLLGGLFFTVGAVIYITKRPNFYPGVFGFHEIWHIFVILGCLCHFILITSYIASPSIGA
jgi:hemolysin III